MLTTFNTQFVNAQISDLEVSQDGAVTKASVQIVNWVHEIYNQDDYTHPVIVNAFGEAAEKLIDHIKYATKMVSAQLRRASEPDVDPDAEINDLMGSKYFPLWSISGSAYLNADAEEIVEDSDYPVLTDHSLYVNLDFATASMFQNRHAWGQDSKLRCLNKTLLIANVGRGINKLASTGGWRVKNSDKNPDYLQMSINAYIVQGKQNPMEMPDGSLREKAYFNFQISLKGMKESDAAYRVYESITQSTDAHPATFDLVRQPGAIQVEGALGFWLDKDGLPRMTFDNVWSLREFKVLRNFNDTLASTSYESISDSVTEDDFDIDLDFDDEDDDLLDFDEDIEEDIPIDEDIKKDIPVEKVENEEISKVPTLTENSRRRRR